MFGNEDGYNNSMEKKKLNGKGIASTAVTSVRYDLRDLATLVKNYQILGIEVYNIGGFLREVLHDYAEALKKLGREKGENLTFETTEEAIGFLRRHNLHINLASFKMKKQMEKENRTLDAIKGKDIEPKFKKLEELSNSDEIQKQADEFLKTFNK